MLKNKTILITGGSGSFAHTAIPIFLDEGVAQIIVYSRDEYKQMLMMKQFKDDRMIFRIGDVRDIDRLKECSQGADVIIHAAAMKHVDFCENNKIEAIKTNVNGAENVVTAALHHNIPLSINLSADKAVYPAGVYGETKAQAEKIFIDANLKAQSQKKRSKFANLRTSNVLGSRGSVVEIFTSLLLANKTITVTNDKMVRLVITQKQVVEMVIYAIKNIVGGEIFLRENPVIKISDLATAMQKHIGKGQVNITNEIRPGEKYDAVLIGEEESSRTLISSDNYWVIIPKNQERSIYTKVYGDKPFTRGEYGTHNAKSLDVNGIIKFMYNE